MSDDILTDDKEKTADKQRKSRDLELLTISTIMKLENGRDLMWRCLQNCCTFENIFNTDPILHAHNAGARAQGLWLERELKEAAPGDYIKMLQEHIDE